MRIAKGVIVLFKLALDTFIEFNEFGILNVYKKFLLLFSFGILILLSVFSSFYYFNYLIALLVKLFNDNKDKDIGSFDFSIYDYNYF